VGALLSPNQVIAYNLARARALRGWTQTQAIENLAPFVGARWSKANYSAAERSIAGTRVRQFTGDEIVAFARAFGLPVAWFFVPPPDLQGIRVGHERVLPVEFLRSMFEDRERHVDGSLAETVENLPARERRKLAGLETFPELGDALIAREIDSDRREELEARLREIADSLEEARKRVLDKVARAYEQGEETT
jgi:transcriptional regulator with XRE-family HTH domain